MQLTKKQMEFWTVILVLCLGTAFLVLVIDFGIKAAILEESNRLRLKIEGWEVANGRGTAETNAVGIGDDAPVNTDLSGDVLVDEPTRMEAANVPDGTTEKAHTPNGNRAQPSRQARTRRIQTRDKQV